MSPSGNFAWLQRTKVERLGASAIAKRNFRIKRVGKIHCPIPLTPSLSRRAEHYPYFFTIIPQDLLGKC